MPNEKSLETQAPPLAATSVPQHRDHPNTQDNHSPHSVGASSETDVQVASETREGKLDEDMLAIDLAQGWEGKARVFYGSWRIYDTGSWQTRQLAQVRQAAKIFLRQYRRRGIAISARLVASVVKLAEDECFISDQLVNDLVVERRKFINLQNGLYNLETYQLESHKPDLYFINQLPFKFDPQADCPTFKRFLKTSLVTEDGKPDDDMRFFVQEAIAYSMTARTDLKASFWLVGEPDSGKSTLISLLRSLMGSLHATIDLNQLATNRFMLSGIVGKRIVTFTEASVGSYLPDALYKAIVGGEDEIWADVKNKEAVAFRPEAKFWWAMNDAPKTKDTSGAVFNRLRLILFNRTIPHDERIANLSGLLALELPGIFNWLMVGYRRLIQTKKFTEPEQALKWLETYRMENDTEATFVNECCERDLDLKTGRVQSETLHRCYREWCIDAGFHARNRNNFARDMRRLGFEDRRIDGKTYWFGLRLKDVYAQNYSRY